MSLLSEDHLSSVPCVPASVRVSLPAHNGCLVLRQAILSQLPPSSDSSGRNIEKGQMGQIFLWCQFLIAVEYFKYLDFPPVLLQATGWHCIEK